ncbi:hypothetical protein PV386_04200 [Streptomyces europaeiscabiei]|nr:hypothetical protein [Streptomyces europaeiscabiei]MDX3841032.1 hypothetical protein [Streptomyces europaeiscabiei]
MAVSPDDVAADHAALFLVGGVVGAVEGDVAQGGELRFYAVKPGAVGRGVGDLDVARGGPGADLRAFLRGQVRGEMSQTNRDAGLGRVEASQVAAEFQELRAFLGGGVRGRGLSARPASGSREVFQVFRR